MTALRTVKRTLDPEAYDPGQPVEHGQHRGVIWALGVEQKAKTDSRWVVCEDGTVRLLMLEKYKNQAGTMMLRPTNWQAGYEYTPKNALPYSLDAWQETGEPEDMLPEHDAASDVDVRALERKAKPKAPRAPRKPKPLIVTAAEAMAEPVALEPGDLPVHIVGGEHHGKTFVLPASANQVGKDDDPRKTEHASVAAIEAAYDAGAKAKAKAEGRCACKGYGYVRKAGPNKGLAYKTRNGALESAAKGNADPCPSCNAAVAS